MLVRKIISILLALFMTFSLMSTSVLRVHADTITYNDGSTDEEDLVEQGENGNDFAKNAGLTNIYIIDDMVDSIEDNNNAKVWLNPEAESAGFYIGQIEATDATWQDIENMLIYSAHDGTKTRLVSGENKISFSKPIATYTFKNAARLSDESTADVVVAYDGVTLIPAKDEYLSYYGDITLGAGNGFHGIVSESVDAPESNDMYRMGIKIDFSVYVEKDKEKVDGTFLFPVKGLTVLRSTSSGWVNDYSPDYEDLHFFNEAVIVNSGYVKRNGHAFYIPGGKDSAGYGYTAGIDDTYFYARESASEDPDKDNSFYSGFITVADNSTGIDLTYIMGVAFKTKGDKLYYGVNNNLLFGTNAYQIKATTGVGGTCETTVDGNPDGDLSDGSDIIDSDSDPQQSVPAGKYITYKMTPKPGYKLKNVIVKNGSTDVTGGKEVTPVEQVKECSVL